jgi:hypothetical protein
LTKYNNGSSYCASFIDRNCTRIKNEASKIKRNTDLGDPRATGPTKTKKRRDQLYI